MIIMFSYFQYLAELPYYSLQEGSAKFVDTIRSNTKQLQKFIDKLPQEYVSVLCL